MERRGDRLNVFRRRIFEYLCEITLSPLTVRNVLYLSVMKKTYSLNRFTEKKGQLYKNYIFTGYINSIPLKLPFTLWQALPSLLNCSLPCALAIDGKTNCRWIICQLFIHQMIILFALKNYLFPQNTQFRHKIKSWLGDFCFADKMVFHIQTLTFFLVWCSCKNTHC